MICGRAAGQTPGPLSQLTLRSSRVRFAASDGGSYDWASAVAATLLGLTQALGAMKYAIAAIVSALMILAGIALGGAGHGWGPGAFGCFALSAVCFMAWSNALSPSPSRAVAIAALSAGLVVCAAVAVTTLWDGSEGLVRYLHFNGAFGAAIAALAYLNWLLISGLALHRARHGHSSGT